ncbi:hypothetical protein AVEN_10681-1 [Araneus ventricosus]|uniref:Uncharacterized protein n=1 Tax=Araneus ventricosus TaxID=182803 RepID=A0A4Y2EVN0_ARAVE|nr:hypothetical protein AVEN_10681-1 [Araneus ventricosus]
MFISETRAQLPVGQVSALRSVIHGTETQFLKPLDVRPCERLLSHRRRLVNVKIENVSLKNQNKCGHRCALFAVHEIPTKECLFEKVSLYFFSGFQVHGFETEFH